VGSLLFKKDNLSTLEAHVDKKFKKFFFMMYQIKN